ncbi:hypothetical protein B1C78_15945 [Thioalkalivibrio denitrificans]|uniref:Uncharacterized protein n=1 Tax=Thioalkalivibrio denitrificans TaxID=108003 RepID=A0A1V3N9T3_9GAMM|nr:hypothetical protein B1C78_15945 [Thioalkalivibrio denitrificans]
MNVRKRACKIKSRTAKDAKVCAKGARLFHRRISFAHTFASLAVSLSHFGHPVDGEPRAEHQRKGKKQAHPPLRGTLEPAGPAR